MEEKIRSVNKIIKLVAQMSIEKASSVLEKLLKNGAKIEVERIYLSDISEVTAKMNAEEAQIIGAFIDLKGDAEFKFLLFVNERDSFSLADMMLKRPIGTTKVFDKYAYSSVQEVGNILSSAIAGVFSADFQIKLRPSPPRVIHDFSGTVFEEYILASALAEDEVLIIESMFKIVGYGLRCSMYIIPVNDSDKILNYMVTNA